MGGISMPASALRSAFIKAETRDLAAATGDVAYTNYGFTPRGLFIFAFLNINNASSWGASDPAKAMISWAFVSPTTITPSITKVVNCTNVAGDGQTALVKSYDVDGFTLTWTHLGAGVGTVLLTVAAIR